MYKKTDVWIYRPRGIISIEPIYDKLNNLVGLDDKKILHLFAGKSKVGETCDVNNTFNPTYNIDCTAELPFEDNSYDVVFAEPPYYDGHDYGCKPYSFVKESIRVLKIGGYFIVMHPIRYTIPKGCIGYALIGISTGPNLKARWLNVFQKVEHKLNEYVKSDESMRKMV
jgi:SAM-dependent methyltransferase